MVIANCNNDIGEYWEFSDTGWLPIDLSNEAYKLGVNYSHQRDNTLMAGQEEPKQ